MIANVVLVLLSLQHAASIKMYSTESKTRIGYALAAAIGVSDPLVVGCVTQMWLLELVRMQFLSEFGGLNPLSALGYLRVRLASVVPAGFMGRLPRVRRVSIIFAVVFCIDK